VATPIAEAFVLVRPDTKGFAAALRTQLNAQLREFKPPIIKVGLTVTQTEIAALQRKIKAATFTIPVELVIAPGSLNRLQKLVKEAAAAQKAIPINVTTKITQTAATQAAASTTGTAVARAAAGASGASAAEKAATNLALLQKQVGFSASEAAKRTYDYQVAVDRATQANNALSESEKFLKNQQAQANIEGIKTGESLRAQARDAQALAQARVQVLAATRTGTAPVNADASVAEATKRAQLAVADLNEAQVLLQSEAVKSNAALERQAQTLVNTRTQVLAEAEAVKASAIAQEEFAASAKAAAASSAEAAAALATAQGLHADVPKAAVASTHDLTDARRASAQATRADEAAEVALNKAVVIGDEAMIASATATKADTAALALHKAELLANAEAAHALLPAQTAIARVNTLVAKANDPLGVTRIEQAKRAATSAAAAANAAEAIQVQVQAGTLAASAGLQKEIDLLVVDTAALEKRTAAAYQTAKADQARAAAGAQAGRGAAATGASFLGLRGAVLSSSAPFLAATIAITTLSKVLGSAGQLQESLHTFQAATGATAEEMKKVDELAIKLGGDVKLPATSASDAANAMTELAKAGLSVADSQTAARGALELAAAANIDATAAAGATASILNQFNLAGVKATQVTDLLAGASIKAQGSIQDFVEGFRALGPTANLAGVSVDRTAALLTELGKAGLAGAFGGTSLKTFLLDLVPASKPAEEAMKSLGVQLDKTKTIGEQLPRLISEYIAGLEKLGPTQQQAALKTIFGTRGIQAAGVVFSAGTAKLLALQKELDTAGFGATLTEARMKGLTGGVDALGSATQTLGTTLGTFLVPAMTAVVHGATNIVTAMGKVAQALTPLAEASKVIGKIPGGGDAIATLGLTIALAKGLQAAWAKISVEAVKAAASIGKAAGLESETVSEAVKLAEIEGSVNKTLAIQNSLRAEGLGLTEKQTAASGAGAIAQLAQNRASLIGRSLLSNKGGTAAIGAGIAASLAGNAIGGRAGGFLSAAGTGAVLGSFIPGVGTVVGAGIGAGAAVFLKAITDAKAEAARQAAQAKSEWQAMTFQEQQAYLRKNFPQLADPNADPLDSFNLVQSRKANPNLANAQRTVANLTKELARRKDAGLPIDDLELTIRQAKVRVLQLKKDAGDLAGDFVDAAGGFNIPPAAVAKAREILTRTQKAQADFFASIGFAPNQLNAIQQATVRVRQSIKVVGDLRVVVREFLVANAAVTGDFAPAENAVAGQINSLQRQINIIQGALLVPNADLSGFLITGQKKIDLTKAVTKLMKELASAQQTMLQLINDSFALPEAQVSTAQTRAQGTKSFADNIVADNAAVQEANDKLAEMIAKNKANPNKVTALDIEKQRGVVAGAQNQLIADQASQQSANEQAVADQLSAQEAGLRLAADAAGNLGAAETKLIKFLEVQVNKQKRNTIAFFNAEEALSSEQQKQAAAIKEHTQINFDLRQSAIDAAQSAAALTDTNADNIAGDKRQIKLIDDEIRNAEAVARKARGEGVDAWRKAKTEVNKLIAEKNAAIGKLKDDMTGGGSGFTLQQLFGESIRQFQEFGSNVSTAPRTTGQARGDFSGTLLKTILGSAKDRRELGIDSIASSSADSLIVLRKILLAVGGPDLTAVTAKSVHDDSSGPPGFSTWTNQRRWHRWAKGWS
jgi:TP901 family phage tail tape measure protein